MKTDFRDESKINAKFAKKKKKFGCNQKKD